MKLSWSFLVLNWLLIHSAAPRPIDDSDRLPANVQKRSAVSSRNQRRSLWRKNELTWSLSGNVASKRQISHARVVALLNESFEDWQSKTCFKFKYLEHDPASTADIKVVFTNDNESSHKSCERRFNGAAGHAFFRYHKKNPAQIHINNELFWLEASGSISLRTILKHEIGHVLGLYHSPDVDSIMYEFIFTNRLKEITKRDVSDINKIYGSLCSDVRVA